MCFVDVVAVVLFLELGVAYRSAFHCDDLFLVTFWLYMCRPLPVRFTFTTCDPALELCKKWAKAVFLERSLNSAARELKCPPLPDVLVRDEEECGCVTAPQPVANQCWRVCMSCGKNV